MNYYAARQRQSDGRFDFTCRNDDQTWPVGYCRAHKVWTAADFKGLYSSDDQRTAEAAKLNAKYEPLAHKFHADGHATAEEAQACYCQYLLDTQLEFSKDHQPKPEAAEQARDALGPGSVKPEAVERTQRQCRQCQTWTEGLAWLDMQSWPLCEQHQTREVVEGLFPKVGTITSSY